MDSTAAERYFEAGSRSRSRDRGGLEYGIAMACVFDIAKALFELLRIPTRTALHMALLILPLDRKFLFRPN
jgi:hypothetical protein